MAKPLDPPPSPAPDDAPPWLRIARAELGVREWPGAARTNPRIVEYFGATTLRTHALGQSDETAWCSAFVCWTFERAGIRSPRSARARDWLRWGVPIQYPRLGCVAVLWRGTPKGRYGHVGLYHRDGLPVDDQLDLLGGNQRPTAGQVSVAPYPAVRLLGYRWPIGEPVPGKG